MVMNTLLKYCNWNSEIITASYPKKADTKTI